MRKSRKNNLLKKEIVKLDAQIADIQDLENRKQRLVARMEIIEKLQRKRPEIVHQFDELVRTVPDGVYLTSIKQNGKQARNQRRRSIEHARVDVHAQYRFLRVDGQPRAAGRRDREGFSDRRLELHAVHRYGRRESGGWRRINGEKGCGKMKLYRSTAHARPARSRPMAAGGSRFLRRPDIRRMRRIRLVLAGVERGPAGAAEGGSG